MKKVLIITSRSEKTVAWKQREQYVRDFCQSVSDLLEDTTVTYTTYRDLLFTVTDGRPAIFDMVSQVDLETYDLIHFKNWQYEVGQAPVVAEYLHTKGVPFVNSEVRNRLAFGKLAQMFILAIHGIPVPDTLFAFKEVLREHFERGTPPAGFSYPFIMKDDDGSKGDDNHLVRSAKEALDILSASAPDKQYVLQNFVPNDGDYRLLYIGIDNENPLIFHRKAVAGSHLNNTSKGGTGTFIDPDKFPAEFIRYARDAAELLGREIGGVDVLIDKDSGRAYILEVNSTPALATGYGVDVKTKRFARFLQQTLEGREEE